MALVALCGCARGGIDRKALDLYRALDTAEVLAEVAEIDIGEDSARSHLISGWSDDESSGGDSFVWGLAESSELQFFLASVRPLRLSAQLRPFSFPGAPAPALGLELNGQAIASLELDDDWQLRTAALPRRSLRPGRNRIRFLYSASAAPNSLSDSPDRRPLAVAWDWIRFDSVDTADRPASDGGRLVLPAGSEVGYYIETRKGLHLQFGALSFRGAATRLEVTWQTDGEQEEALATLSRPRRSWRLELPGVGYGVARLGLRVAGEDGLALIDAPSLSAAEPRTSRLPSTSQEGAAASPSPLSEQLLPRPHVLLYLVDALRSDSLTCYGQALPVSPRVDGFAAESMLFERAYAQSSWTIPATASIHTGLLPTRHGLHHAGLGLTQDAETLAERLRAAGYRTAAFVDNSSLAPPSGFEQGFETFDVDASPGARADERARRWLAARSGEEPFFLYVHTMEPHQPLRPADDLRLRFAGDAEVELDTMPARPEPTTSLERARWNSYRALYLASVADADRRFGTILDALAQRRLEQRTVVVFVADHGEGFFEHASFGHGHDLHAEVLDIPLLIRAPAGFPGRTSVPVQQIDIAPTLLDYAGVPQAALQGDSLRPLLEGRFGDTWGGRIVFSWLELPSSHQLSVVWREWKLLESFSSEDGFVRRLFGPNDRAEIDDRAAERSVLASYLSARAREARDHGSRVPSMVRPITRDPATSERLRALGYLD